MLITPNRTRHLRSSDQNVFCVPRIKTKMGEGSYSVVVPKLWNRLPCEIRISKTDQSFINKLKPCYFNQAFPTWFLCVLACSVGDPE